MRVSGLVRTRLLTVGAILVATWLATGCTITTTTNGALAPDDQQGGGEVSAVEDFYEPLSAHGAWMDDPQYGKVWQPSDEVVGEDFVPYASGGEWAESDDGYAFQSQWDADWGWATYHYGRWYQSDDYGWVWVPGTEWAPAWVDWRYGGGYVGWVPLAPAGYMVAEDHWTFVEERHFGSPGIVRYRVGPERVHGVYVSAAPIMTVSTRGRWRAGPPVARIRAGGGSVRTVHTGRPTRGGYARGGRGRAAGGGYAGARGGSGARAGGHTTAAPKRVATPKRKSSPSRGGKHR